MNTVEVLTMVFGGGALGAGLSKLIDRLVAHNLARKDKLADDKLADAEKMAADVADHDARILCLEKAAARSDKSDQIVCKALNALLSHSITGNATGEMRKVQKELVDSIIENH
jgi:hypothetical protein